MGMSWLTTTVLTGAGTFAAKYVGSWLAQKLGERKWAKLEKKIGATTSLEAPPPAVFAPAPPTPAEQLELEHQRTKVKQVLIGAELLEAQNALHKLRTLIDEARSEAARQTANYVVERQRNDELQKQMAGLQAKHDELFQAGLKLKAENEYLRQEGDSNVSRDNQHPAPRDGRHIGGRLINPGIPLPPRIPGFSKGPKPSGGS